MEKPQTLALNLFILLNTLTLHQSGDLLTLFFIRYHQRKFESVLSLWLPWFSLSNGYVTKSVVVVTRSLLSVASTVAISMPCSWSSRYVDGPAV